MADKKYCIVVLDNTENVEMDLNLLSVEPINIINSQNGTVSLATFVSPLSPPRIKKALNCGDRRTFFVFELNAETCSTHIDDLDLHEFLFLELDEESEVVIDKENKEFLEEYKEYITNDDYDEDFLLGLSETEREELMDKLLSNVRNLTKNQKKILSFIASM